MFYSCFILTVLPTFLFVGLSSPSSKKWHKLNLYVETFSKTAGIAFLELSHPPAEQGSKERRNYRLLPSAHSYMSIKCNTNMYKCLFVALIAQLQIGSKNLSRTHIR